MPIIPHSNLLAPLLLHSTLSITCLTALILVCTNFLVEPVPLSITIPSILVLILHTSKLVMRAIRGGLGQFVNNSGNAVEVCGGVLVGAGVGVWVGIGGADGRDGGILGVCRSGVVVGVGLVLGLGLVDLGELVCRVFDARAAVLEDFKGFETSDSQRRQVIEMGMPKPINTGLRAELTRSMEIKYQDLNEEKDSNSKRESAAAQKQLQMIEYPIKSEMEKEGKKMAKNWDAFEDGL